MMSDPDEPSASASAGEHDSGDADRSTRPRAPSSSPTTPESERVKKWFRPTNNRSAIWKHMQHDEKKTLVKCDHCPRTFAFITGSTSTLRRHLENVHFENLADPEIDKAPNKDKGPRQLCIKAAFAKYEFNI